jgi:hypothetical protein
MLSIGGAELTVPAHDVSFAFGRAVAVGDGDEHGRKRQQGR